MVVQTLVFSVWSRPLPSIMDSAGFSVRRLESVAVSGRELLRLDFDLDPRPPKKVALSGHVILDPNLSFCVKEYEVRVSFRPAPHFPPTIVRGSVTYDETRGGLPRPVEVFNSQTRLRAGTKGEQRSRFRVERVAHDRIPSEKIIPLQRSVSATLPSPVRDRRLNRPA